MGFGWRREARIRPLSIVGSAVNGTDEIEGGR